MSFCLALALMSLTCLLTMTTPHPHYGKEEKTEVLQIGSSQRSLVDGIKVQEPTLEINMFVENKDPEELSNHRHRRSPQDFDDDVEDSTGNRGKGNKGKAKGKDKKKDKCNNGNGRGNGHGRCKNNKKNKELTQNNDTKNEGTSEAKERTTDLEKYVRRDKLGLWAERRRRSDKGNSGEFNHSHAGADGDNFGQENNYLTKKKSFDKEQNLQKVEFDDSQREAEEDALDQISLALSRNKRSVFDDDENILENPDSDFEDKRGFGARVKCFGGIGSWGVVSYRPPVVVGTPIGGGGGVIGGGGGTGGGGGGTGGGGGGTTGGGGTFGGGGANLGGQYRSAQYSSRTGGRGRSQSRGRSYRRRQNYRPQVVYIQQPAYVETVYVEPMYYGNQQPVYSNQQPVYSNQQPVYSNQQQRYGNQQQGYAASHGRTNPDAEVMGSYRSG